MYWVIKLYIVPSGLYLSAGSIEVEVKIYKPSLAINTVTINNEWNEICHYTVMEMTGVNGVSW